MTWRPFVLALAAAPLLMAATSATPVTVVAPGQVVTAALRQALTRRMATAGLAATFSAWDGKLPTLQRRAASGGVEPDVLLMPEAAALSACAEGLLRTLAPDDARCVTPGFAAALVLAWDKTRDPTPPDWQDFWDVARYPGKRGLPRQARGTLEIALMADGVAPADVYRTLAGRTGVERAFRKLDQLRPYVVWWTDGDAATRALTAGGVLMTVAPARYEAAQGGTAAAAGQQWNAALLEQLDWAVPLRAPDPGAAWRFLRLQQDAAWQAAVTLSTPIVGLAPGVQDAIADDLLARTPAAPTRALHMLPIDGAFWRDHADLEGRFGAWVAQNG
jgi:putative spermidine/putrescine transport system substrate-binding protein